MPLIPLPVSPGQEEHHSAENSSRSIGGDVLCSIRDVTTAYMNKRKRVQGHHMISQESAAKMYL